jgi:hypothetical protein
VLDPELNLEEKRIEQDVCGRYDEYMHWCQVITNVFLPDIKRKLRDKTMFLVEYVEDSRARHPSHWIGPTDTQTNDVIMRPFRRKPGWPYDSLAFVLRQDSFGVDGLGLRKGDSGRPNEMDGHHGDFRLVGCSVGVVWPEPYKYPGTREINII